MDASSLLEVRRICAGDEIRAAAVFDALFALARANKLGFPPCVPSDCRKFDPSNFAASWAAPTHATLAIKSVSYSYQVDVLAASPRLLDEDSADEEQPQVEVVAYALKFQEDGQQTTIITEDTLSLPFRDDIGSAAARLGIAVLSMNDFMTQRGL